MDQPLLPSFLPSHTNLRAYLYVCPPNVNGHPEIFEAFACLVSFNFRISSLFLLVSPTVHNFFMDNATLEITLISAADIKNGRRFGRRMRTYASVWSDPAALKSTGIDRDGGSNPTWNQKLQVPLTRSFIHRKDSSVVIKIYCETMLGKKQVGWTKVPFSDIVDGNGAARNSLHFLSYRLRTSKGKPHGTINLSVRLLGYTPPMRTPLQPKLRNDQHAVGSKPRNEWGPSFLNASYTDERRQQNQNVAAYGGSSCAIGIPISVGRPPRLPYPPQGSQGSHGNMLNANYYSPIPTSIYPPYPPSQPLSYGH